MNIVAELNEMRDKLKRENESGKNTKILVGMATCGIAAGARPVLAALNESAGKLDNVVVSQTGCIGICQYEPLVEVFEPGKEKVTYVKMTPEMAKEIMEKHIIGGRVVPEYTIGAVVK